MPDLIEELKAAYGQTSLFELLTTDAGNTSLGAATQIVDAGWNYFADLFTRSRRGLIMGGPSEGTGA